MADLTLLAPQACYFAWLNTQSQNGLTNILQVIQDGLGRNTPLSLSQIGLDINTTMGMGGGFSIDGTQLLATAAQINNVCYNASFAAFTTALKLPNGTTAQRPGIPANGDIRYNSTSQAGELYAAGAWMTINAGNPSGYYPGFPTYLQDTYAGGTFNVSMGTPAPDITFRTECTLVGDSVAPSASSGSRLCAFGYQSLMSISSGSDNSAFGHMSGKSLVAGLGNCYFGKSSGQSNTVGDRNSFFGTQSGTNATGADNSFYGAACGTTLITGDENSFFGSLACENSDVVSECCAFGFSSLQENEQAKNSAFGARSATSNISGANLDVFGYSALASNILGDGNSSFAQSSLFSTIDGDFNCAFGFETIYSSTFGDSISAFGYQALRNSTESLNAAFGFKAGLSVITGLSNSFFGASAGETGVVSGITGCTLLGAETTIVTGLTNATAIGYQASAITDDSIVLGKPGTYVAIGHSDPTYPLDVIGDVYFEGILSGYSSTGMLIRQDGISTSGITPLFVDFIIDSSENNILSTIVRISVINTAGDKAAYATSNAAAIFNGVSSASVGTFPTITFTATAAYTPTAAWSIVGNAIRLTVTGVAASNEIWVISSESFTTYHMST